ncbi:MAG: hypothetical protein BWY75_03269 [bacterium ADurb.Bin425]|nr:MAG: hypothetical protein BWY75_03269 [bacterium ADurb.Bin425]
MNNRLIVDIVDTEYLALIFLTIGSDYFDCPSTVHHMGGSYYLGAVVDKKARALAFLGPVSDRIYFHGLGCVSLLHLFEKRLLTKINTLKVAIQVNDIAWRALAFAILAVFSALVHKKSHAPLLHTNIYPVCSFPTKN